MKKVLSIILAISMIVTTVPMAFAATDTGAPVIIDITEQENIRIGEGLDYYDEDGYIITGTNENVIINVNESCDITLKDATFSYISFSGNYIDVKITLEGDSYCGSHTVSNPGISIYNSNLVIDGGEEDSLTYNGNAGMIAASGQSGTFTVNGGKLFSCVETEDYNVPIESKEFVINGGEVTISTTYSHINETVLNGGVLNIIATTSENVAINTDVIMKRGSLLTVSAEGEILSPWYGFDGFDANILMADGAEETDYFFVRYDKTGEFTPVMDIRAALNGKNYVEIKTDAHVHSFDKSGRCICGYECLHKNLADNKCSDCGAEGDLVIITMTDTYGDDWEDNAIVIEEFAGEESKVIAKTSLSSSQEDNTYITFFNDDYAYRFKWINGYHPAECAFTVTVNGETVYEVSGVSLADGEVFYVYCEHSFENGKCIKCGVECGVDLEHNFEDYTCTICGKYMYQIVHQPSAEELFVTVNNDIGASFQWCTVSYVSGEKIYTAVEGQTHSYLENPVGGNEYACIVTFEDGTTETSESVKIHGCDFSGEWKSDGEKHWKECECGNIGEEAAHSYDDNIWESNEDGHQAKCKCGYKAATEEHEFYDSVCIKCSFCCDHINFKDDLCEACGYRCRHETILSKIIIRPVQNDDGTWNKGSAEKICVLCKKLIATIDVERDHEGYKLFDDACDKLELLLGRDDIIEYNKTAIREPFEDIISKAYSIVYTDAEKDFLAALKSKVEILTANLENGLADGSMKKADFSELKAFLEENDPDNMISEMANRYNGILAFYNEYSGKADDYSHQFYGWALGQLEYETLVAAIKDGSALKADYTEIDKVIAEIEEKLADENVTDEAKVGLEEIKAQLETMKTNPNTSKADLAVLEKALEDYEAELDAGIADGTAVKVDGLEEIVNINDKLNNELAEKYGEEALAEIAEKLDEKFADKFDELYERAEALTGSVAENKDALDEIETEMKAIFAEAENCLNGTHNGLVYEVTEEAKCGENAIESATCTLCGETVTREVENSALKHSFTKYEVTAEAKCGIAGKKVATCDRGCGETDEQAIEALTHTDADGDYKCDNGCGHEFEKPTPEEPTPDTPDEPTDDACDHLCHKGGFIGFIWKIVKFFWKLFKMNPVCECGAAHY